MNLQDDKIKELLSGTEKKAGENLKYRIMHQIESEKALSPKKQKNLSSRPIISNMITIFGVMYGIIAIVGLLLYSKGGAEALNSMTFYGAVMMVTLICGAFWLITSYDDRRRSKHGGHNKN